MAGEAARLEALGEPEVRFVWRDHALTIPRALEDWPLELINRGFYVDAVLELLGGQTAPVPLYGDLVSLSDAMAEAVGVARLPEMTPVPAAECGSRGQIFGAVPLLLFYLNHNEDDIAADLRERFQVDYADRWRGALTLRQIWIYIRRSRPDSALAIARNGGFELWDRQSIITAQVWEQISRQFYAGRPMSKEEIEAVEAKRRKDAETMQKLADKENYYSPEATRARMEANAAVREAKSRVPGATNEPPPEAMSAMDKAMANRRREISSRKAG